MEYTPFLETKFPKVVRGFKIATISIVFKKPKILMTIDRFALRIF
jgi:hypothetical protein